MVHSRRLERQRLGPVVVADLHRLPVADLALEQLPAHRRLQLPLNDPFERPCAVGRIVADADEVFDRLEARYLQVAEDQERDAADRL